MNPLEAPQPASLLQALGARRMAGLRSLRHAIAVVLAATVAWLVFTAYRQPELLLDIGGMRLCVASIVGGVG